MDIFFIAKIQEQLISCLSLDLFPKEQLIKVDSGYNKLYNLKRKNFYYKKYNNFREII
jgi:hypothetical protein